jgi:hypothetical protein
VYNRAGNAICVECGRHMWWGWMRPRNVLPVKLKRRTRKSASTVASLPPPDLPMSFGPRQGEPISVTGMELRASRFARASNAILIGSMAVVLVAVSVALAWVATGHGR